jgi:hypothetical protein
MYSISLLVSTQRPRAEQGGLMEIGPAVVREVRESFPAHRRLFMVFFVSRTPPFSDLDMLTEVVNPDGNVFDASRKPVPLRGTWDFATGSVDLGDVHFPEPGQYLVRLYTKERSAKEWPEDPDCFWSIYATTQEEASGTRTQRRPV